jgi:O-methyltransferase involved in polyketide biosynthesis
MGHDIHIPDPTEPNTGRILDYWLGAHHHFPIDVAAAQAFDTMYGDFPGVFRTLRHYIGRATRFVRNQGVDQFLVFGSGVPASGNVHEVVPDARVLYTDIDRTNVALGQKILAGVSNADYAYCDASNLSTLDRAVVEKTLGPLRRLGVIFVGLAVFISDDDLRRTFDELYALCPPGSFMVLDFDSDALEQHAQVIETLKATGAPFHMRTPETIAPLLGRWRLTGEGIQPVASWGNPEGSDAPAFMYGAVVESP